MKLTILGALVGIAAIAASLGYEVFEWPVVVAWVLVCLYAVAQAVALYAIARSPRG